MQQGDATNVRPATTGLLCDVTEHSDDTLFEGFVGERLDVTATLGIVTHGAREQHHCTAVGPY